MKKRRLLVIVGMVVVVAVLVIVLDTMLANHQPVADLAAPERVVPNGKCEIMCIASDRDGDALGYNWSTSGGDISGTGAAVNWTAPDSAGSYNVTVTVTDGRGGEAVKQVIIEVRANRAPTIVRLAADADWILPSCTLQVTCTASDPDDDELSYEWTASAGDVSGTGAVVTWTAPQEVGVYNVTVVVKDAHGSSDTRKLCTSVVTGQPPNIEPLVVTAEHCYLKTFSWGYKVGKEQEYHIECVVADTSDEVSYSWACDDGAISGEGSMITWTAPDKYLERTTVTVTVSDVAGNMACKSVALNVVSCSACTFGC